MHVNTSLAERIVIFVSFMIISRDSETPIPTQTVINITDNKIVITNSEIAKHTMTNQRIGAIRKDSSCTLQ